MTETKHIVEDFNLFSDILRNSGYRSVSFGVAEIIDNSIDASASDILIICESNGHRIKNIGFLDNGLGMSPEVLWSSLCVGGRFELTSKKRGGHRGRYGFGLPGASAAYSECVEVYSWTKDNPGVVYKVDLNLKNINKGVVKPIEAELPKLCKPLFNENAGISLEGKNVFGPVNFAESGTFVYWKGCERIKPVTTKILVERYLKNDLARIFRHFITSDEFSGKLWNKCNICIAYSTGSGKKINVETLVPNDPLYIMNDHKLIDLDVNFQNQRELSHTFKLNDSEIFVRYSLAPRDVRMKYTGTSNTNDKIGKNTGISIVREGREIDLSDFEYYKFDQRHRWWGCEIFFNSSSDIFFGVPANKQHVDSLKEAIEFDDVEGAQYPIDSPKEDWPIWLTLEREFNIREIISDFLKTIKQYPGMPETPPGEKSPQPEEGTDSGDLKDDPSDEGEETTSGTEIRKKDSEAFENAKIELKKVGIDKPTQGQIERFLRNKVVLSYLPLGEGLGFISISLAKGVCHLKVNTDSNFYLSVLAEIKERRDDGLEEVYRGIELLLLSYARCMDLHRNYETSKEFPRVLSKWSAKVEELLEDYLNS